jgi:NAD(P)-dependent dehydrogenase (short-subunit alcohol dehydrogenase family)
VDDVAVADSLTGLALVTGGGRGIGANIARELAGAGMRVAVTGRTAAQVEAVAAEVGGTALAGDVSKREDVERWFAEVGDEIQLLVNNAGMAGPPGPEWETDPDEWWRIFEVNVRGPYFCCREAIPHMAARGGGRIVNVASGAAYLPAGPSDAAYGASKAALHRFSEILAEQAREAGVHVFSISPGLVRTSMTERFGDDLPWTPPELAPRLVRVLASGRADALAGRYLHAEHDDIEELIRRADEIRDNDLNAIRLRR